jgi:RNA polymerase sigma-70 factor (ECF subfamily)
VDRDETVSRDPELTGRESDEEDQLVQRLREGDAAAGHEFVRDYYPGVYRYLLYLSGSPETAEDLAQETFLRAWRHLDQFRRRAPLSAWLHRIARREFLQEVRRRRPQVALEQAPEAAAPAGADWTESMELRDAIAALPAAEGEVVTLHYLYGYDCQEIAEIVRAPVGTVKYWLARGRAHLQSALGEDDLIFVNEQQSPMHRWAWLPLEEMHALEARLVPRSVGENKEQTMERREFLRHAAAGAAGLALTEGEVVDDRLTRKVTLAFKGTALSDLCDHLRAETGVRLAADASVADEKVTIFCRKMPLRDVMRQLSRPFGYTWMRSSTAGEHRYELVEDMRSQLLAEELRTRDRNAALLALDREMQRYRPFLDLSPEEAEARARTATPVEKPLLENLARYGWGPIQMYFRLSRDEMAALRAGKTLVFSTVPRPGEHSLPLEVARGVLQGLRYWRVTPGQQVGDQLGIYAYDEAAKQMPDDPAPAAVPEARVRVDLAIAESELGRFAFSGGPGCFTVSDIYRNFDVTGPDGPWAAGRAFARAQASNPTAVRPGNRAINARWERDRTMRARVNVSLQPSCRLEKYPGPIHYPRQKYPGPLGQPRRGEPPTGLIGERVTSADLLEALHLASGQPIVSDYYTQLYDPGDLSLGNQTLFDALNQLADALALRWDRDTEGGWLRFRSASFYTDRLKEVPNRLLTRWSAARKERGHLTLDELIEIAGLSDTQLDPRSTAEGARACYGLVEWELARHPALRPLLRDLAHFSPAQRDEALGPAGLRYDRMTPAQQQLFLSQALVPPISNPQAAGLRWPRYSLDDMEGSVLRIDYTQPGGFEWVPQCPGPWQTWLMPRELGPDGRREPRPPVRGRTREATLQALRRFAPELREAIYESLRRGGASLPPPVDPSREIYPVELNLTFVYVPGASHRLPVRIVGAAHGSSQWTGESWERE